MNYCAIIPSKLSGIILNEVHLYKLQVLEEKKKPGVCCPFLPVPREA